MRKRNILLVGGGVNFIDVAGAELLVQETTRRRAQRGDLFLCEFQPQVHRVLTRGGYLEKIGTEHIFATQRDAVAKIISKADGTTCQYCKHPLFLECPVFHSTSAPERQRDKEKSLPSSLNKGSEGKG